MERKLISIVKKYPELYDREHSNYPQLKVNKALWGEVGKEMRLPGDDCQIVWRRLKRNYLHNINRKRAGEDCFVDYENEMQFLINLYEENSVTGYIPECSDEEDGEKQQKQQNKIKVKNVNDAKKNVVKEVDVISISESDSCNEASDSDDGDDESENQHSDNDVIFNGVFEIDSGKVEESLHSTIVKFKDKRKLTKAMRRDIKDLENKYKHVDIRKLISLVEKIPPLYDIRRQDYHHFRGKKSTLWEQIGRSMNCTAGECSKTWHIIKKFYFDYLENRNKGNKTCWLYEKDMTFMYPIYVERVQRTKAMLETQLLRPVLSVDDERRIEFDRRVIEAVKMYPALYNAQHTDFFRYRNNKDIFWERVAVRVNAPVDYCRRSWTNSKKSYLHYLERELETNTLSNWRFKNEMAFLRPIYEYKRNVVEHIDLSTIDQNDERKELERKLVQAVQKYPPLFDIRLPEFVNLRVKKGLMWAKVSAEVSCSVDECRKIWRALVTCYLQFLRRKQSGAKIYNNWRLEKEMAYLKPVYSGTVSNSPLYSSVIDTKDEQRYSEEDRLKIKIIHTVRKFPALYDVKHPNFINSRNKHIPIWMKIGKEVGCPAEQCRNIWNDLRRMYISYEKRKAAGARVSPWKFAGAMSFYDLLIGENGKIARAFDTKTGEILYRDNRRDFERQLIELVKNCPQLYDYTREDYVVTTDISQRKVLWTEIGKRLNATGQECSTTWRNLKKFYVNSIQRPVPGESPLGRKWKFKEEMKFLLPLYKNKRHYTRVRIEDIDESSMNLSCNEYTSDDASSNAAISFDLTGMDEDEEGYVAAFGENFFQNCEEFEGYAGIYVKAEYTDCETICAELNEYKRSTKIEPSNLGDSADCGSSSDCMYLMKNIKTENNTES